MQEKGQNMHYKSQNMQRSIFIRLSILHVFHALQLKKQCVTHFLIHFHPSIVAFYKSRVTESWNFHKMMFYKRKLYFAWSQCYLCSNALAFLPRINKGEQEKIQTACNSAIRAIYGLPRYGFTPINRLRENLKIPSVADLTYKLLLEAASLQ